MSSVPNLVAGRLSRNFSPSYSGQTRPSLTVTGYGVSRLGLIRPRAARAEQPASPAAARLPMRDGVPLKKVTASLTLPLTNRLKAYCGVAGRFQYDVIGAAIDRYLLDLVGQLNDAQKEEMAEIAAGLCGAAGPAEAGDGPAAAAAPPETPTETPSEADGDGAIAASAETLAAPIIADPDDTAAHGPGRLIGILCHLMPHCWRS